MNPEKKTRCILVDDEPLAIEVLRSLLARFENIEVVAECSDSYQAFEALQNQQVDLMFLDIHMPELSGMDFLKSLSNPPAVIFTTAHREFAFEAFDLDVVDYLLKPISGTRLMKAIDRYLKLHPPPEKNRNSNSVIDEESFLIVRAGRKFQKIMLKNILYIQSIKDYVKIHKDRESIMTRATLADMEKKLPPGQFIRIHRSYIINRSKITAITNQDVELGNVEIPVGENYRKKIEDLIKPNP